jgi:hypothetical protein
MGLKGDEKIVTRTWYKVFGYLSFASSNLDAAISLCTFSSTFIGPSSLPYISSLTRLTSYESLVRRVPYSIYLFLYRSDHHNTLQPVLRLRC